MTIQRITNLSFLTKKIPVFKNVPCNSTLSKFVMLYWRPVFAFIQAEPHRMVFSSETKHENKMSFTIRFDMFEAELHIQIRLFFTNIFLFIDQYPPSFLTLPPFLLLYISDSAKCAQQCMDAFHLQSLTYDQTTMNHG